MDKAPETAPDGQLDLSALTDSLGFRMHILDLRMMKALGERCAAHGLTPGSASVLMIIKRNPGVRHGELADALLIQRPNMTKLMKRLEAQGLVRRLPSDGDRRRVVLGLTPRGETAVAGVRADFAAHEDIVQAQFTQHERAVMASFVQRMHLALDAVGEAQPQSGVKTGAR
jgi:DNA-binding MarR family transcriptional regulator